MFPLLFTLIRIDHFIRQSDRQRDIQETKHIFTIKSKSSEKQTQNFFYKMDEHVKKPISFDESEMNENWKEKLFCFTFCKWTPSSYWR